MNSPDDRPDDPCESLDQRVQQGELDQSLFEAMAHCLETEVRRFAQTRCGSVGGDVEDISQDALLAAQRYLSSFRGEASLRTWLFRLVLSACSRHRRGRKNDPGLHRALDEVEPLQDSGGDPEVAALMGERLDALSRAIERLRPEDRQMLDQVEWQGLSLAEVAKQHELTVSAIKSRMFRIRQQLREQVMAKLGDGEAREPGGPGA